METKITKKPSLKTRGRTFKGNVVSAKAQKTVTVSWNRRVYIPKYERYQIKRSKVKAHNPPEIGAKEGDEVIIKECRPLSKTKKFVVTVVIKK
jgi:small subunit ribosomal protein S17